MNMSTTTESNEEKAQLVSFQSRIIQNRKIIFKDLHGLLLWAMWMLKLDYQLYETDVTERYGIGTRNDRRR